MRDDADPVDRIPEAPAWRHWIAHTIDIVAALAVFSLFLTPVIAVQGYSAATPSLKVIAWVYLGVFVVLAVLWALKKRHRREYVTIGMSIMGGSRRLSGRVAAAIGMPLIVAAIGFFVYELIVYA